MCTQFPGHINQKGSFLCKFRLNSSISNNVRALKEKNWKIL